MADLENGYTRIANELIDEVIKRKFNGTQYSIILCVIRHTYGYQRKSHDMSVTFIAEHTQIHRDRIKKELKFLIDRKVIHVFEEAGFSKSRVIGMNKHVEAWSVPLNGETSKDDSEPSGEENNTSREIEPRVGIEPEGAYLTPGEPEELLLPLGANPSPIPGGESAPHIKKDIKDINKLIYTVFEHWNSKKIVVHRELTEARKKCINARLKVNTVEELNEAVDNYAFCVDSDEHYFTYKWGIHDFMKPDNVERFLTANNPLENFRKNRGSQKATEERRGSPPVADSMSDDDFIEQLRRGGQPT